MQNNTICFNKTSIISVIILIVILIISYFFYSLNQYIKQIFDENKRVNAKVLTDIIKTPLNAKISKETLISIIKQLNYIKVNVIPQNEGEYFEEIEENNDNIYIFRRQINRNKYNIPPVIYKINFNKNLISCLNQEICNEFVLEELPLASSKNLKDKIQYQKLSSFNKTLINTLILIEDKKFYKHFGIDIKGIFRAIYINVINWNTKQGASTITQQLVKNLFLNREKNLLRKIKEAFLSIYIECFYSKDEILEKYLNTVYLGQDKNTAIKGFYEASKFYFNKNINELDLSQISLLVGMIKAPSAYSPILNYNSAIKRRNVVLKKLLDEKIIDEITYQNEVAKKIILNIKSSKQINDNYFYDALLSEIPNKVLNKTSLIITGINPLFQTCAQKAIDDNIEKLKSYPKLNNVQIALVSIDSKTGLITSYIGGKNYSLSQFDRVRQSKRQIGSLIKPFIYLAALDPNLNSYKQATPISILKDAPLTLGNHKKTWRPANYDKKYRGFVTLRESLEKSLNIPTINLTMKVGLKNIISLLKNVNIIPPNDTNLSLALGAIDLSLLNITSAYTAFSNNGHFISPRFYSEIYDKNNNILKKFNIYEKNIASPEATFILNTILQGVIKNGTAHNAKNLGLNLDYAGKTGTSDSQRDNWFIGYNTQYVTGVWVGLDNNDKMPFTGAHTALPIFVEYAMCISKYTQNEPFKKPTNVDEILINKFTYDKCDNTSPYTNKNFNIQNDCYKEYFIKKISTEKTIKDTSINIKKISKERNFFDIALN